MWKDVSVHGESLNLKVTYRPSGCVKRTYRGFFVQIALTPPRERMPAKYWRG